MDVRVIGGGAAAAMFGLGSLGYVSMGDVLGEIRSVSEVPRAERQAYMDGVVAELDDAYGFYAVEGEGFAFVADIEFFGDAKTLIFGERIQSEDAVSAEDRKMIAAEYKRWDYCSTEDALMFTTKGWDYTVTIRDGAGTLIAEDRCRASGTTTLRGLSS